MEAMLLATVLSCADGAWILSGINSVPFEEHEKSELIIEVLQAMPDDCSDEQYNPTGRK